MPLFLCLLLPFFILVSGYITLKMSGEYFLSFLYMVEWCLILIEADFASAPPNKTLQSVNKLEV